MLTAEEIARRLAQRTDLPREDPYPPGFLQGAPRPAAVLIPMMQVDSTWQVLFIRRATNDEDKHSGQVAFPGGRCETGDPDPVAAALRETHEEVGVRPADVRILGRMNDYVTITNYRVTPIIGQIDWPYPLRLAEDEVSHSFVVPLHWLADPRNREERRRKLPSGGDSVSVIYFEPYDGELIWGVSARILVSFLEVLELDSGLEPSVANSRRTVEP
jgi:8-oxo-dGTP pyrophosphatase MutT (NUDIX family)